ncbi:MAG: hypothetical protein R3F59_23930 [Myxococcota bacterium]
MATIDEVRRRVAARTEDLRTTLESLPYSGTRRRGTGSAAAYVNHLRALATLEQALSELSPHPARLPGELAGLPDVDDVPAAAARAIALAEWLRASGRRDPAVVAGAAAALDGLAASVVRVPLAARAELALDEAGVERAVEAARALWTGMIGVLGALEPQDEAGWPDVVTALNPEAGAHPITADPRALRAALRAGERTWHAFPYYALRYGERGHRYMRSDSGWLARIAEDDDGTVLRQVWWLGGLLASRGMPRCLLAAHLEHLADALDDAAAGPRARHDRLRRGALALHDARQRWVSDAVSDAIDAAFDARVGPDLRGSCAGRAAWWRRPSPTRRTNVRGDAVAWLTTAEAVPAPARAAAAEAAAAARADLG